MCLSVFDDGFGVVCVYVVVDFIDEEVSMFVCVEVDVCWCVCVVDVFDEFEWLKCLFVFDGGVKGEWGVDVGVVCVCECEYRCEYCGRRGAN